MWQEQRSYQDLKEALSERDEVGMIKTFCDRCGKEITEEYGWITHRMLYASIRLLSGKKHTEWSKREELYICPECEDSYVRWFMNPGIEDRR